MSEILFADIASEDVEREVLATYEQITGTTLYPADPVRLFLEAMAYTIAVQNNVINLAGRQNLLAYAVGEHLDYIGMMVGTGRQSASHAACQQMFYLNEPLDFDVTIPQGTRATTGDGKAAFATAAFATIAAGELAARVTVEAISPGAFANGLVPGQLNQLIDPVAYIARTANATITLLGSDVESDERYRSRIQAAPEAFSCAGPVGAYRHYTLAAHPDIADAAIYSPEPGTVEVRPVLKGGELPPELVYFDIDFTWYLSRERQAMLTTTTGVVEAAVEEYRLWQRARPGRDVLPIRLASLLERAGVKRIEMRAPAYQGLAGWQLPRERKIAVTFGGVES